MCLLVVAVQLKMVPINAARFDESVQRAALYSSIRRVRSQSTAAILSKIGCLLAHLQWHYACRRNAAHPEPFKFASGFFAAIYCIFRFSLGFLTHIVFLRTESLVVEVDKLKIF